MALPIPSNLCTQSYKGLQNLPLMNAQAECRFDAWGAKVMQGAVGCEALFRAHVRHVPANISRRDEELDGTVLPAATPKTLCEYNPDVASFQSSKCLTL